MSSASLAQLGSLILEERAGWVVRGYDPDRDAEAVSRIDTSFTTTRLYAMLLDDDGVTAPCARIDRKVLADGDLA